MNLNSHVCRFFINELQAWEFKFQESVCAITQFADKFMIDHKVAYKSNDNPNSGCIHTLARYALTLVRRDICQALRLRSPIKLYNEKGCPVRRRNVTRKYDSKINVVQIDTNNDEGTGPDVQGLSDANVVTPTQPATVVTEPDESTKQIIIEEYKQQVKAYAEKVGWFDYKDLNVVCLFFIFFSLFIISQHCFPQILALGEGQEAPLSSSMEAPLPSSTQDDHEVAQSMLSLSNTNPEHAATQDQLENDCYDLFLQDNNVVQRNMAAGKNPRFKPFRREEQSQEPMQHTCKKHDMRTCDPAYDGHYSISYFDNLCGKVTCVKSDCPNAGLTFGQLIKKHIKVHYCKECEEREGKHNCNHVICDACMEKELGNDGTSRRSKRRRN